MKRENIINKSFRAHIRFISLRSILTAGAFALSIATAGQVPVTGTADTAEYVTGIVRDAKTKEPLVAARIQSLSHEAATTTDENGEFKIQIVSPSEILMVRAYDYDPREVAVRGRQSLEIDLYPLLFTDIYKEVEGITGPKTSSFLTNATKGIYDMGHPTVVSLDDVIQERMGGDIRLIKHSGVGGIGSTMFIRGLNSINLSAQPLLVVDGVIWDNYPPTTSLHDGFQNNLLSLIDLVDIESVSVIKDGVSLYGSKGANGVILVRTVRGRDVATKITVNATGGLISMPSSLPVMNGDQFRIYISDLLGTTDMPASEIEELDFFKDDPAELSYKKYHNSTNWDKEVYEQGIFQSYNISVSGGDKKALYAFSMGYTGNRGVVKSTSMQRLNTRFNADFNMSDRITTGLNVGFTNIDRNLLDDGVNFYTSPTYHAMIKASFLNPYTYTATGEITTDPEDSDDFNVGNPTAIILNSLNTNRQYRLNLGIKPAFQLSPSMVLSSLFDYSLLKLKETYYSPIIGVAVQDVPGLGTSENVFRNLIARDIGFFNDTRLDYNHRFGQVHRLNAFVGWRYLSKFYESDFAEGHNSGSDQKRNLLTEEDFKTTSGFNDEIKSVSNYANVDYSYDNRYFITATVSMDASSRFGKETTGGFQLFNRSWGIFPAVNAAWLVSSEKFMAGAGFVDQLKLRGGYGMSGNDAIEPYAWSAYFNSVPYMDRANGLVLDNIANTEIQWETTGRLNVGIDANLFNDRLALSADLYNNHTSDLLLLKSLPEVTGSGYFWNNGGELSNKGFEISTVVKLLNLNFFKWEFGASAGHYKNRIESLPDGDFITSAYGAEILTSVGNPAGVFYGYKTNGVFTSASEAEAANLKIVDQDGIETYFGAGDIHFEDFVSDGIIDEKDRQIIGDPNPDFFGSFNSRITIKNFSVDAFFTFSYGNEIYNYLRAELESGSDFINQTTAMLNRWFYEGQETSQPKLAYGDPMGNARFSDRWIEDGSYLRLKSLSINYRLPLNINVIDEINIWASVNNLWTLSNYLGRDPEVSVQKDVLFQGIDTGLIPVTRSFYFGIKLSL